MILNSEKLARTLPVEQAPGRHKLSTIEKLASACKSGVTCLFS
jgi:hypothetical protein